MQYFAYPEPYGPHLPEHTDVMTAEQALIDVTISLQNTGLTPVEVEELLADTRWNAPAEDNLYAIKTSADYHGLSVPVPVELEGVWSAGWNEPGYLPNPDVVANFLSEEDAREYIDNEREYWGDDGNLEFWVEYVKSA